MSILITLIHVFVCFVLIAVILLQAGRGQGLTGASFGGGNVQSLFGTKGSVFLQKATSVCAILFMITCIGLSILETRKSRSLLESGRAVAPIDVDQIQKALEKVKQDAEALKNPAESGDVIDQAAEAAFTDKEPVTAEDMTKAEQAAAAVSEAAAPAAENAEASPAA